MIDEIVTKLLGKFADGANRLGDRINSAILGKKICNLEISLENSFQGKDGKIPMEIEKYTGRFIVTELGYLIAGYDNKLEKQQAKIADSNPVLPPFIVYENGKTDKLIEDFLGLRLSKLKYKSEMKKKICFA